jgi:hypothetical protein
MVHPGLRDRKKGSASSLLKPSELGQALEIEDKERYQIDPTTLSFVSSITSFVKPVIP